MALDKPDHLRDAPERKPAAMIALAVGAASFVLALAIYDPSWLFLIGAGLASGAAAISVARRERAYTLWAIGLGLAVAALVVTWLVAFILVLGITAALIFVLHHAL